MMKIFLLATSVLFLAFNGFAQQQEKCGSHIVLQEQLKDPEARAKYEDFQEAVRRYTNNPDVAVQRDENGVRIIPVVFHILHDGGTENISDAKVMQQMEVINEDYRRLNPDTVNTPERFYGDTEYTHLVFNAAAIEAFVRDSSYVMLHNRYEETYVFHFNDGSGALSDSLQDDFAAYTVVEVSVSSNADTADLAMALADAIDGQNGLTAEFVRDTTFEDAPNFTVDGSQVSSLSYTSQPTFTTSWNGSETDTTWSDQLMVVLYENSSEPFTPTDTIYVYQADITYNVYDGSGNVIGTQTFTEEGSLTLIVTAVPVAFGDHIVKVSTDGLGYTDDVLVAGIWPIASTIVQNGTYLPADCNIEFRLATKDPLGNCTDGIVRVFTPLTNDANNGTGFKRVSYWNAYSYLNVWVVNNIDMDLGTGTVLGYAQFPASGLLSTDGITVIASNIDVATSGGRTATHEIGHWLNLKHIWGDALCGSDDVLDTPTAANPNFGVCGNATGGGSATAYHDTPYNVPGCDPDNPDGEMFNNYMDYSDDACMNMFTLGQKARMDYTLEGDGSSPGIRSYLISQENLEGTGVADPYTQPECAPISSFYFDQGTDFRTVKMICAGGEVDFEEDAYNGAVTDYLWTFEGGDPATATTANPSSTYNTPGVYDVTLQVSNDVGSDTHTEENMVMVSSTTADYQSSWGYVDSFWSEQHFLDNYVVFNQDGSDNKWEWYFGEDGGYTGWESVRMFNIDNDLGAVDELISPSYDMSGITGATLKFRYSGAAIDNSPSDRLEVRFSDDCGETWGPSRLTLEGFELTNAGLVSQSYRPNENSTWTDVTVNIGSADQNKPNLRVLFRWISGQRSNNFYIDDVTLAASPLGMEDLERQVDLSIAPNPTIDMTTVSMSLPDAANVRMEMMDILGKNITPMLNRDMTNGTHRFDIDMSGFTSGVYYLRIFVDNDMVVKKVVKN